MKFACVYVCMYSLFLSSLFMEDVENHNNIFYVIFNLEETKYPLFIFSIGDLFSILVAALLPEYGILSLFVVNLIFINISCTHGY